MPIEVAWYVEGRVIALRQAAEFHFADQEAAVAMLLAYLNAAGQTLHIIQDASAASQSPLALVGAADITRQRLNLQPVFEHPRLGCWAHLGLHSKLAVLLIQLIDQPFEVNSRVVDSLPAAHAFLLECDPSLAALLPPLPEEA